MGGLIVLKVGTKNLMVGGHLDQGVFNDLARQTAEVQKDGKKVLIVSSGAVQAGRERLSSLGFNENNFIKKEMAGIGARHLLNRWGEAFACYNKEISQFWLTYANLQDNNERKSIRTGILNCLDVGLVPIVNENDVISDAEIVFMEKKFSENDRLARMTASLVSAEGVLFLTDAGGIYEEDPRKNPKARMYEEINPFVFGTKIISGISDVGRGGIETKIEEAKACFLAGMRVSVAGMEGDVLIKFCRGESVGTKLGKFPRFK